MILPILAVSYSVNHRAPSGPGVMKRGPESRSRDRIRRPNSVCREAPDLVRAVLEEPEIAIGARRNASREVEPAQEFRDHSVGRDPADLSALCEPEVAVGAGRDLVGPAVGREEVEFRDLTGRGHATNPVAVELGKPEISVRTGGDPHRTRSHRKRKLRDDSVRRDLADVARPRIREPQVPVGTCGDALRGAEVTRRWKFRGHAQRRDPADLAGTDIAGDGSFRKPEVPVRPRRDRPEPGTTGGNSKFVEDSADAEPPDPARVEFGEPEVAIRTRRRCRQESLRGRNREFGDRLGKRASSAQAQSSDRNHDTNATGNHWEAHGPLHSERKGWKPPRSDPVPIAAAMSSSKAQKILRTGPWAQNPPPRPVVILSNAPVGARFHF